MATSTFSGVIRSGRVDGTLFETVGVAQLTQFVDVAVVPTSGTAVFLTLPASAQITGIQFILSSSLAADASMRIGTARNGSDNVGFVAISAKGLYNVNYALAANASAVTTFPNMSVGASSQTLFISAVSANGQINPIAGNMRCVVNYFRPATSPQALSVPG